MDCSKCARPFQPGDVPEDILNDGGVIVFQARCPGCKEVVWLVPPAAPNEAPAAP